MNSRSLRSARGFTLIEIMVVVVIIGLLAAVILPNVFGNVEKAQITKAKSDIQAIETALTMFKLDNFKYPSTDLGLHALVQRPNDPTDPQLARRRLPQARRATIPGAIRISMFSRERAAGIRPLLLGADSQEGGEGENADIGNWNLDQ